MSRKLKFSKRSQGERRETSLRRSGKKLNHLFRLESKPKIENNFEKNLNRTGRRSSYIMNNSRDRRRWIFYKNGRRSLWTDCLNYLIGNISLRLIQIKLNECCITDLGECIQMFQRMIWMNGQLLGRDNWIPGFKKTQLCERGNWKVKLKLIFLWFHFSFFHIFILLSTK